MTAFSSVQRDGVMLPGGEHCAVGCLGESIGMPRREHCAVGCELLRCRSRLCTRSFQVASHRVLETGHGGGMSEGCSVPSACLQGQDSGAILLGLVSHLWSKRAPRPARFCCACLLMYMQGGAWPLPMRERCVCVHSLLTLEAMTSSVDGSCSTTCAVMSGVKAIMRDAARSGDRP